MRYLSIIVLVALAGCGAKQTEGPTTVEGESVIEVESTTVEARVVGYQEAMLQVEDDAGNTETLDATELEVLSPESLTGKKLFICHDGQAGEDSVWRKSGAHVSFEFSEADLEPVGCAYVSDEKVDVTEIAPP